MKRFYFILIILSSSCVAAFAQTNQKFPCPTISVVGPAGLITPNETATFTANVTNGDSLTYIWTVSAGTIVEGQNSPVIRVATTPEMTNSNTTATVEIKGLPDNCTKTASETVSIGYICRLPLTLDDYDNIPFKEEKERLKSVATNLVNQPETKAFFTMYFPKKQDLRQNNYAEKIKNYLTLTLKIPKERLIFIYGESEAQRTRIMLVPNDALEVEPNQEKTF